MLMHYQWYSEACYTNIKIRGGARYNITDIYRVRFNRVNLLILLLVLMVPSLDHYLVCRSEWRTQFRPHTVHSRQLRISAPKGKSTQNQHWEDQSSQKHITLLIALN